MVSLCIQHQNGVFGNPAFVDEITGRAGALIKGLKINFPHPGKVVWDVADSRMSQYWQQVHTDAVQTQIIQAGFHTLSHLDSHSCTNAARRDLVLSVICT